MDDKHPTVTIGDRRELFTDYLLVDSLKRAELRLHEPRAENVALHFDRPWEGAVSKTCTVVRDDNRFLLYYRAWGVQGIPKLAAACVAESADGIEWTRPELGLHEHKGSLKNNIVLADSPATMGFVPFRDTNPNAEPSARFKALTFPKYGLQDEGLIAYGSADGIHWSPLWNEPVLRNDSGHAALAFDSQNVSFWSETEGQYVAYFRTWSGLADPGPHTQADPRHGLRRISRATSPDYRSWHPSVQMQYLTHGKPSPEEHLYVNQTEPYFRAPHIYIALPARFMAERQAITDGEAERLGLHEAQIPACSEPCFMTTRPGHDYYDRTFMGPLRKPGIGPEHWSARSNYPSYGVIQTSPTEMSLFIDECYAQAENRLRRHTLRLDGFCSVHTGYGGGELITKPLSFTGSELELNYATGVSGGLRVEIRDASGAPVPGYTLRDAVEVFGNRIAGVAQWKHGSDVAQLAGKPVRLRFVMRDTDLYSLRFCRQRTGH